MKRTPAILFAAFFCFATAADAFASDAFLDTCLALARERDRKLLVAQEQINLAKARVTRSARGFFPSVTLQRRYTRGKASMTQEEYQSEELGLRLYQPVYEGGRQRAAYRYDSLMEDASRYNYTKAKEELYVRVKLAYYEMLSSRMEYTALKKAFAEIERLLDKVRIEYKAKAISELELVEAENFRDKLYNLLKTAEETHGLATKKLLALIHVDSLEDVPALMPQTLEEDVPEMTFTLEDCKGFVLMNNLSLRINQHQILMAEEQRKMNRSKVIPKLYLDGFYGQSGEAFVSQPLSPATSWSVMTRLAWSLWGSSLEASYQNEKTNINEMVDPAARNDTTTQSVKLSLFDDMAYFVDTKEGNLNYRQAQAEYQDTITQVTLELEKAYNDYISSLRNARTLRNEIELKERKLELLKKRNQLYEVPTVQVMEESWKYAETLSSFARTLYTNHASVTELERMTLMTLR